MRMRRSFIWDSTWARRPSSSLCLAVSCVELTFDLGDGRRLVGLDGLVERRDPALSGLQGLGVLPQALIDPLQCSERFDLCAQVSPPLCDLRVAPLRVSVVRHAWAQCDSNTRPAGYEPAALTV